jgi:hypothetical protein
VKEGRNAKEGRKTLRKDGKLEGSTREEKWGKRLCEGRQECDGRQKNLA